MSKKFEEVNQQAAEKIKEALFKLTGLVIELRLSVVARKKVQEIKSFINPEEKVVGLFLPIQGNLEGAGLIIFYPETAFALADLLQKREIGTTSSLCELDKSALKELGNIVACNYLSVFSNQLKITIQEKGVYFSFDMFGSIVEGVISELKEKEAVILEIIFSFEAMTRKGNILFLFDPEKMEGFFGRN